MGASMAKGYRARDTLLKRLGYPSYRAYLQSALWQKLRRDALERDSWTCRLCGGRATEVHHETYSEKLLAGRTIDGLVSICRTCHQWVEFTRFGNKRDVKRVTKITRLMTEDGA